MKTVLVAINAKYIHTNLAIRYIRSCSLEYGFEIFEATINENPLQVAWAILDKKPQLVGLSCYIWNIDFTLKLCGILKAAQPQLVIVLGGPEADFDWAALMERHDFIDYIIRGEGEYSFRMLYEALALNSHKLEDIGGLCYRNEGKLESNPKSCAIDLDRLPFPYEQVEENRICYYEASRGCPFNCSYCLSSTIKGIKYRSVEKVKEDLMWFIDRDVPLVKFIDRTFNSSKRFSMEIWRFLIENTRNTCFHFEIGADLLDDEAIELLSTAPKGLFQFEIGVQTTNEAVLKNINRIMNFTKLSKNVRRITENDNIECHVDLIAGLPGEDLQSFRRSFDSCMAIAPQMLQLGFLKVLKGSPMMECVKEYDLRFMPCAPYQILRTKDMHLGDMRLLIKLEEMVEDFYNSRIIPLSMSIIMGKNESQFDFFKAFSGFAEDKGYFLRRFDLKDKFFLIYDFCSSIVEPEQLKQLLAIDYLLTTKKTYLPEFLQAEISDSCRKDIDSIKQSLGKQDLKSMVFMPVTIRVLKEGKKFDIEKKNGICCVNVKTGNITYYESLQHGY